jgi:hypothetical protein
MVTPGITNLDLRGIIIEVLNQNRTSLQLIWKLVYDSYNQNDDL